MLKSGLDMDEPLPPPPHEAIKAARAHRVTGEGLVLCTRVPPSRDVGVAVDEEIPCQAHHSKSWGGVTILLGDCSRSFAFLQNLMWQRAADL